VQGASGYTFLDVVTPRPQASAMNCFVHNGVASVGVCFACQKAVCRECVGRSEPRILCSTCLKRGPVLGFEYKSAATIAGWPLVHVCMGVDATTMRPKVAKGIIAVGNVAVGVFALGGVSLGLCTIGGLSVGLAAALGGAALGLGLSVGGLAVGSVALGGAAIGFKAALGGAAFGPAIIDGRRCDEAARALIVQLFGGGALPPHCR
jgi:hypothetical protein